MAIRSSSGFSNLRPGVFQIPTKPPETLTHSLPLANLASESTGPSSRLSRPSTSPNFCRLPCSGSSLFCLLVSGVFCPVLFCSATLPSLVLFQPRGRSRVQALCVCFVPKLTKGSSDWHSLTPTQRMPNIVPHWLDQVYNDFFFLFSCLYPNLSSIFLSFYCKCLRLTWGKLSIERRQSIIFFKSMAAVIKIKF